MHLTSLTAGYIVSNEDSTGPYRYKLKPYYGFMHFDYKPTGSNFKLEWVAGERKLVRARVTNDDSPNFFWKPTVSLAVRLAMNMKPDHPIYK